MAGLRSIRYRRRSRGIAPRVYRGASRHLETPNYYNTPQEFPVVDRIKPGRGYVHLLRKRDVTDFVQMIPKWEDLALGLDAIVLSNGSPQHYGWHVPGVVHICAWPRHLWELCEQDFLSENSEILEMLGVESERAGSMQRLLWTREQARAFQLLDVLLHELGHHHDRMSTRSQHDSSRGEPYADSFAEERRAELWETFAQHFVF